MSLASAPPPGTPVPEVLVELAGGPVIPVWLNEAGGLTVRTTTGPDRHLKWSPADGPDLAAEAARLRWAGRFTTVPAVLAHGRTDEGQWLVTATLPGRSAVDPRSLAEPTRTVAALGAGLRSLHDALPVDRCPFAWSLVERRECAAERFRPTFEHRSLSDVEIRARLAEAPDLDPVVCHGDACAPNTLLADDGSVTGHVDLGSLGVADRWADLAVAAWSVTWNLGPGHETELYDAYGVPRDPAKEAYYRLLWAAT